MARLIRKIDHALAAAAFHGGQSDPDREVGELQDVVHMLWQFIPAIKRATVLQKLDGYFREVIGEDTDADDLDQIDYGAPA